MATTKMTTDLTNCDEEVPLLGVTREFDFGQFIELFDSSPDPQHPDVPIVSHVVIQPSSKLAADRNSVTGGAVGSSSAALTARPEPTLRSAALGVYTPEATTFRPQNIGREQEVDLFDLTEHGPGAKLTPIHVEIKDRDTFFETSQIKIEGNSYKVSLDKSTLRCTDDGICRYCLCRACKKNLDCHLCPSQSFATF